MPAKLDRYDRLLLAAVQEDARVSQSKLGQRVNLSTAAVNRRLKSLADAGAIERYAACVNPNAVGYGLTIVVEVMVESERADLLDAMRQSFNACEQVQQCYYVAGECDFVLIFVVRDMAQYVELTRRLFQDNNNVKAFKTLVAMDRIKTGMHVPIDDETS
ncbi:Lrp/AsnC family transcriptional regulator [Chitinasiproducens palmae]|uniref:DNA-binding transcriptional regulator, Lrp family n=1 Tax=Chitinasiproducens palmae TaxID=1770053 RepID=A0A1H2PQ77_9BURK|nr:Lrp/AsnC family transcriptional regulator [Chitinasiproducens palmae]SDV48953.1 DNA-binding transcriptional regulator, Lrp family [Chitinasiproducens palmae]